MKSEKAKALLEQIGATYKKEGLTSEKIINQMKDLREYAKEEKNPFVTKLLRLSYEHIEANKSFDLKLEDEEYDEDMDNFENLLMLVGDSENKYNHEEIVEIIDHLLALNG